MSDQQLRRSVLNLLLERVESETYPSVPLMNQLEAEVGTDEELRARFVDILAAKIAADRFPSPDLIKRTLRLVR